MTKPKMIRGKHVLFPIKDSNGQIDCAAYEPTDNLRKCAVKLIEGDFVEVSGGVRPASEDKPLTLNLEKMRLLRLAAKTVFQNPPCPNCGKRLKSMGRGQGLRCEKCRLRYPRLMKTQIGLKRDISGGLYITSVRSQRHLTKPFTRYGLEKNRNAVSGLIDGWHFP
jgi:tRNA(Ile2)-agmatinylcytidine synthase